MQYLTKIQKRRLDKKNKELQDLKFEKERLEKLRDTRPIFDAVVFYLERAQLTKSEIQELREALAILTRSG